MTFDTAAQLLRTDLPTLEAPSRHFGSTLTIDVGAIVANYATLRRAAAPARAAAVVKADAYGLGVARVAPALYGVGCRTFFVALVDEGVALRRHLPPDAEIVVLNGAPPGSEATCAACRLMPVINGWKQFEAWRDEAGDDGSPTRCVVQFDTGMSRFGFPLVAAQAVAVAFLDAPGLKVALVMSHLACADDPSDLENARQLARMERLRGLFPGAALSLAASSGIFLGAPFHLDLVRPGAALYGVSPVRGGANPMAPVVRLQGRVVQLRHVPAGAGIGYGHAGRASAPMRLATVSVGYADGLPRSLASRGAAWLDDVRLPIVGRVSMDSIVVDATAVPEADLSEGDYVDLVCPHQDLDDLARAAGTIGYEILTGMGHRYRRDYVGIPE